MATLPTALWTAYRWLSPIRDTIGDAMGACCRRLRAHRAAASLGCVDLIVLEGGDHRAAMEFLAVPLATIDELVASSTHFPPDSEFIVVQHATEDNSQEMRLAYSSLEEINAVQIQADLSEGRTGTLEYIDLQLHTDDGQPPQNVYDCLLPYKVPGNFIPMAVVLYEAKARKAASAYTLRGLRLDSTTGDLVLEDIDGDVIMA